MDAMLALVSALFIPIGTLIMLDALSDRRYREVALSIIMTIVLGVIHYVCISELPDPHHFPWYWREGGISGSYLFGDYFCGVLCMQFEAQR